MRAGGEGVPEWGEGRVAGVASAIGELIAPRCNIEIIDGDIDFSGAVAANCERHPID